MSFFFVAFFAFFAPHYITLYQLVQEPNYFPTTEHKEACEGRYTTLINEMSNRLNMFAGNGLAEYFTTMAVASRRRLQPNLHFA